MRRATASTFSQTRGFGDPPNTDPEVKSPELRRPLAGMRRFTSIDRSLDMPSSVKGLSCHQPLSYSPGRTASFGDRSFGRFHDLDDHKDSTGHDEFLGPSRRGRSQSPGPRQSQDSPLSMKQTQLGSPEGAFLSHGGASKHSDLPLSGPVRDSPSSGSSGGGVGFLLRRTSSSSLSSSSVQQHGASGSPVARHREFK